MKLGRILILVGLGLAVSLLAALSWDPEGLQANLEALAMVRADQRRDAELKRQREAAREQLAEEEARRARFVIESEVARQAELRRQQEVAHLKPPREVPVLQCPLPRVIASPSLGPPPR